MKRNTSLLYTLYGCFGVLLLLSAGCKKRDLSDLEQPSYPTTAEVFIDDFTSDLAYAAFGGSDVRAFQVDNQVAYNNTKASMRIEVPDANSPQGSYAGGVYFSKTGRDLSGYNALTFFVKSTMPATINVVGLGNDLGASQHVVSLSGLAVNSNWKKVIIPVPDPSKLKVEKGLFYYSAAPINGSGYTLWFDEVKFENIPTLANMTGYVRGGNADSLTKAETGDSASMASFRASVNLPTGVNETVDVSPYYFAYTSSDASVATVSENGMVRVIGAGTTVVTATLGGKPATGSLKIISSGTPVMPATAAPVPPARNASDVISLYSNAYTNVPVDTWNTHWQFSTAENSFIKINNDDVIRYRYLNFVGIEFQHPTINITPMRYMHMDIWTPDPTALPNNFKVLLVDFGANGVFGGGDDVQHEITVTAPTLVSNNWVSLDVPLSQFTGLTTRAHVAQLVLSGTVPNVYVDNVYFYKLPTAPATAAPVPTRAASDVLSIFSDTYTNVAGTDFNPNWGQSTITTQEAIAGNNTLHYANFNYQGTQLGSNQDVSSYGFLHLDYYTTNASQLRIFAISPGPVETPYTLTVPTAGWNSVDIPLSAFAPVNLSSIFQFKFDANGATDLPDIYLDNIYFWKIPAVPTVAAPTPTYPAASVISIYSDAYTNVAGTDFFPNWGQSTQYSQVAIAGNNAIKYSNLNYQGIQFGSNQDVSSYQYLHVDYYSANATSLNIYLICPPGSAGGQAPWEKAYALPVPTASGWNSVDIPLSHFTPIVALNNTFQFKFDGGTGSQTIYLDNIVFHQ